MEFSTLQDPQGCRARHSIFPSPAAADAAPVVPTGLLEALEPIPDPRDRRGVRYQLSTLLAVGVCAMTSAGHNSFAAIAEWVRRCDQDVLARLGCPFDPFAGRYRAAEFKKFLTGSSAEGIQLCRFP